MDPKQGKDVDGYQMTLARDLIIYLFTVITHTLTYAQASELVGKIMETWTGRIEHHVTEIHKDHVKRISAHASEEDTPDVIDLLVRTHEALPDMLREEFIEMILGDVQHIIVSKKK